MARPPRPQDDSDGASRSPRRARVEELEPRVLLSADTPWGAVDALLTSDAADASTRLAEPPSGRVTSATDSEQHATSRELVFVDAGIEDYEGLVEDLLARDPGASRSLEVVILHSDRDGITQISQALAGRSDLDAVHIVSHGTDAGLQLGGTWLDGQSLDLRAGEIADWRDVLSEDADLLLYGCNLAGSTEGKALVEQLAGLTGADVAASIDATGAALLGGDWELEHRTGAIEASIAFSAQAQQIYGGVLDGTAIWAENFSTIPATSDFDGSAFAAALPTQDVGGEWRVIAGAEAPTRDEKIVIGMTESGSLEVLVWNGAAWTADSPAGLGSVTLGDVDKWSFDVAYESQSGDGVLTWNDGSGGIGTSVWNGSGWSAPVSITPPTAGEAIQLRMAADPTSDEMVLVASNSNREVYAFVWDGDAWDTGRLFPTGNSSVNSTDISVAYEQQSGDAMIVFGDSSEDAHYRVWNGSTWSGGGISNAGGAVGPVRWTTLAADPNSDRLVLGVGTDFNTTWLSVWDGDSWEASQRAANNAPHSDRQAIAVAFESVSGQAIAVYAEGGGPDIRYQTWTPGSGWSGEFSGPLLSSHPDSLTLDADPNSDGVMLSVVEMNREVSFGLWDGDAWGAPDTLGTDAGTNRGQPFLFLWDDEVTQTISVTGAASIQEGSAYTLNLFATVPGETITGWTINWGDGAIDSVGDVASATHTYTLGGFTRNITASVTTNLGTYTASDLFLTSNASDSLFRADGNDGSLLQEFGDLDGLNNPVDIEIGPDGMIYATGFASNDIRRYDPTDGSFAGVFATGLNAPGRLAFGPGGDLFVSNTLTGEVLRFDSAGTPQGAFVTAGSGGLVTPDGLAFGPAGDLYVASDGNGKILRFDGLTGEFIEEFAVVGSTGFTDLKFGPGGDLYVSSVSANTVQRFDGDTGAWIEDFVTGGIGGMAGFQFGPDGNLYVADFLGAEIVRYDGADGSFDIDFVSAPGPSSPIDLVFAPAHQVTVTPLPPIAGDSLWVSMQDPIAVAPGPLSAGDLIRFGDPGLVLEPGSTQGTATIGFDVDRFATDADIDAIHYVGSDIQVGASSFQLRQGDLLLSISDGSATFQSLSPVLDVGFTNDLTVGREDVFVFRPDVAGDYGSGTFSLLLANPTGDPITGITLIEQDVRVGDADLQAGDFLFTRSSGGAAENIYLFETTDVGGATAGTERLLLDGQDPGVALDQKIYGIDVVETRTIIGGRTLEAGTLLLTFEQAGNAGKNGLFFDSYDMVALDVVRTTWVAGGGNGIALASLLAEGGDVPLTVGGGLDGLTLGGPAADLTNAAPVLVPAAPTLAPITEDEQTNTGDLVSDLLGTSVSDADSTAVEGIAITGIGTPNGSWQYSTDGGAIWTAVPLTVSDTTALLLRATDRIRFVPDGMNGETATFDFRAWDQTSGVAGATADTSLPGTSSAFSVASDTASILVSDVNDAPTLNATATPVLADVAEDAGAPLGAVGTRISDLIDLAGGGGLDNSSDVDNSAVTGIALTDTDETNGTWHYSTDDGASWQLVGSVTPTAARLLAADPTTRLYFQADPDWNGTVTDAITFHAWDQSSGTNGATADTASAGSFDSPFSAATDTADITVTAANDAPSGTDVTITTDEDVPYAFTIADFGYSDGDGDLLQGVFITTIPGTGTLRNGVSVLIGGETISEADIGAGNLVFTPAPGASGTGYTSFTFQVQDDGGLPGIDTDPTPNTITIDVTGLNDAPVLVPAAPTLAPITEDEQTNTGDLVSDLLGTSVSDADSTAVEGIAITGIGTPNGSWQYSTDGGAIWTAVPLTVSDTTALLLRATDRIRFVPDGMNGETATFDFRAWDQTSGVAGATADTSLPGTSSAFSVASDTASILVSDVNDAPTLNATATPVLADVAEDAGAPLGAVGTRISDLIDLAGGGGLDNSSDVDNSAVTGIALTDTDETNGTWHYSTDDGASWQLVGSVTPTAARLLAADPTTRLYFQADPDWNGTVTDAITFHAWDQSSGTNGATADTASAGSFDSPFSAATDTADITVTAANDAPSGTDVTITTDEDVPYAFTIADFGYSDGDGDLLQGVFITTIPGTGTLRNGVSVLIGGETISEADIGAGNLVFTPAPGASGTGYTSFTFQVQDDGGLPGIDTDPTPNTITIDVTGLNDAPVLVPAAPTLAPITEDEQTNTGDLVSDLLGTSVSDADSTAVEGIAITGIGTPNGSWQYSTDGGAIWTAVPLTVSDTTALLLRATDRIRFVPDGMNGETATFDFRAWDQTSGVAGATADTSLPGTSSAFSVASDTASILVSDVNDAPLLDDTGVMTLVDVGESDPNPAGDTVAAIVTSAGSDRITDVDNGAVEGIAVLAVDDSNGSWQYSTDGGFIWTAFGNVSNMSATLLDNTARVRFVPSAGYTGSSGDIFFHAWDQSVGVNGQSGVDPSSTGLASAFSVANETASTNVVSQNFAPVLTPSAPSLPSITEDQVSNAGASVSSIVGGSITDANLGALEGIAVTGITNSNGRWEHSLDGGATWTTTPGSVSNASALLLDASDRMRFVPDARNADAASFDFRAWDQTREAAGTRVDVSTNGAQTAFSAASDTASIVVTAVNDAPSLGNGSLAPIAADTVDPGGATVASLFGGSFTDVDAGASLAGVAAVGNGADSTTEGVWQYSSDGTTWYAVGAVNDGGSALALSAGTRLRFLPEPTFAGTPTRLDVRGIDDSYTGSFSSTGGGEARATIDTSTSGGAAGISASPVSVATSILPASLDPGDLEEEETLPEEEETPETTPEEETPAEEEAAVPDAVPLPDGRDTSPPGVGALPTGPTGTPIPILHTAGQDGGEFSLELPAEREDDDRRDASIARTALDVLGDIYAGRSPIDGDTLAGLIFQGQRGEFLGELDIAKQDIELLTGLETRLVSSTVAVSSGLSVGYVLWLTRGGLLMASLLSSLPAWRLIDPIPILARLGLDEDETDDTDDSLNSLVQSDENKSQPRTDDQGPVGDLEASTWDS